MIRIGDNFVPSWVRVHHSGRFYVASAFTGAVEFAGQQVQSAGQTDTVLLAYEADGTLQWGRSWGTDARDEPAALATSSDGGVVLAFTERVLGGGSRMRVVAFGASGQQKWERDLGAGRADAVATRGNHTFVTGLWRPQPALSFRFFTRLDSQGSDLWWRSVDGISGFSSPTGMQVDSAGRLWFAGSLSGQVELIPGQPLSASDFDVFQFVFAAMDGATRSAVSYPAAGHQSQGRGLAVAGSTVLLGGSLDAPVDFGGGELVNSGRAGYVAAFDVFHVHRWSTLVSQPVVDVRFDSGGRAYALTLGPTPYGTARLLTFDSAGSSTQATSFSPARLIDFDVGDCLYVAGRTRGAATLGGQSFSASKQGEGFVFIGKLP